MNFVGGKCHNNVGRRLMALSMWETARNFFAEVLNIFNCQIFFALPFL